LGNKKIQQLQNTRLYASKSRNQFCLTVFAVYSTEIRLHSSPSDNTDRTLYQRGWCSSSLLCRTLCNSEPLKQPHFFYLQNAWVQKQFLLSVLCFKLIAKNNNFFPHNSISVQDYGFCFRWFSTELDVFILRLKVAYVTELFLKILCVCISVITKLNCLRNGNWLKLFSECSFITVVTLIWIFVLKWFKVGNVQGELNFQKYKNHAGPNSAYKLYAPFRLTLFVFFS